ncbi:hypothetical protein PanWU01x14_069100 [Parasponia andersonii]|uniref:Uncharacterized protein n=1 Tax=Parasponia andersonii TaxID=3476 RepID=A0A2P5DFJ1_PARAD|nr:hypothetical protein PanWU01x14_069100 [Parasponia andersonii]
MDRSDTRCDALINCLTLSSGRIRVFIVRAFHNEEGATYVMAKGEDNCILFLAAFIFEASSPLEVEL